VLSPDALLVAGGDALTDTAEHHGPGRFLVASRAGGKKLVQCELPAPAILDGMALTGTGVFVSALDGSVVYLRDGQ